MPEQNSERKLITMSLSKAVSDGEQYTVNNAKGMLWKRQPIPFTLRTTTTTLVHLIAYYLPLKSETNMLGTLPTASLRIKP